MTLKYKCKNCGQKYDISIEIEEPKTIVCQQCGRKVYVLLNIFETSKGDHYYSPTATQKPSQGKDIVGDAKEPNVDADDPFGDTMGEK